jgi:hypothetical protein
MIRGNKSDPVCAKSSSMSCNDKLVNCGESNEANGVTDVDRNVWLVEQGREGIEELAERSPFPLLTQQENIGFQSRCGEFTWNSRSSGPAGRHDSDVTYTTI